MSVRTTRSPLSRARVLAAAVDLADGEGLGAMTMRRLAGALDVEAMSLYHHVPGKEALLDGLVESVVLEVVAAVASGDAHPPAGESDWRAVLRRRFLTARTVMLAHPWAPGLIGSRSEVPASVFVLYEGILATMVEGGLSYHLAHRALHSFGSMPLGFVQELFSPVPAEAADDGAARAEAAEQELAELAALADVMPHVAAMVASEIHDHDEGTLGWCDSQVEFEFTLDLLLDGLERSR